MGDFGQIGTLPSVDDIKERINERYDQLYHTDDDGKRVPYVCSFCDEVLFCKQDLNFLPIDEVKESRELFEWKNHMKGRLSCNMVPELEDAFKFTSEHVELGDRTWLKGLALSPRGRISRHKARTRPFRFGFSCCNTCKDAIKKKATPLYAIVNQNHVGNAPSCLTELTAVELALITPVKGYGYCFSYIGGAQMNLKGTMTFMKVKEKQIVNAAGQLSGMGLENTIVILLTGGMTPEQKRVCSTRIRVDKVMAAVTWLCANHKNWKKYDLHACIAHFSNMVPDVVDRSQSEDPKDPDVENTEVFSCYFPDGNMDEYRGGFEDLESFKAFVDNMKKQDYEFQLRVDLAREFIQGRDVDHLVDACLLQFPYGVGGMNETRVLPGESYTDDVRLESYLEHLSRLAQPLFQQPMFQLICFTMISKLKLLKRARLQVRGDLTADALANGLDAADLSSAIRGRQAGDRNAGTIAAKSLLKSVDACGESLPHTNEAAKKARSTAESLQHHFGIGSVWLTVTFDDENSLLMQILNDKEIDDDRDPSSLSAEELSSRRDARRELRLNFPGFSAIHFEMLLQIVAEVVIGWDMRRNCATTEPGLFGKCIALAIAIEEQGRKTLHAHITAITEAVRRMQKLMFFGSKSEKALASRILCKYHEHIVSTSLLQGTSFAMKKSFDHPCTQTVVSKRNLPTVVCDQSLREMRHKHGHNACNGKFAYCIHCNHEWTYEQLIESYVRVNGNIEEAELQGNRPSLDETTANIPKCRMLADIIAFQKSSDSIADARTCMCINAVYNHHLSCHTKGCFKCNKLDKRKHVCGPKCECRMRMPDRSRTGTEIKYHGGVDEGLPWFRWTGEELKQPLVEILPKRGTYDLFQNTSCRAISESKLACNSNAAIITDGPIGQYQFKYQHKGTQKDDVADYENVERSIKKLQDRTHEDNKAEAIRRVSRAAFAHNSKNVIGAPMASYLIRNGARFYFSHSFQYCPLKDLMRLLKNEKVGAVAKYDREGSVFFENQALHYLCRPDYLENMSVKDFYEQYETVSNSTYAKKRKRGDPDLKYLRTSGPFQHPSAHKHKRTGVIGATKQGAQLRENRTYVKVPQYLFPDTARFRGSIMSCPVHEISNDMEVYAEVVLTLFMPFRTREDFKPKLAANLNYAFPYTLRLRELMMQDSDARTNLQPPLVFTDSNMEFLQNIQDCAYNGMRYKIGKDDLQSVTQPFRTDADGNVLENDGTEEEEVPEDELDYDQFMLEVDTQSVHDRDSTYLPEVLQHFSLKDIRNRGDHGCGYDDDIPCPPLVDRNGNVVDDEVDFVKFDNGNNSTVPMSVETVPEEVTHELKDVVLLLVTRTTRATRPSIFEYNPEATVTKANGTLRSIFEWAEAAKLDPIQRRAFEIFICSFLLTFFDKCTDEDRETDVNREVRVYHRFYRKVLIEVIGVHEGQIICLLYGPGGSGKTTVINLVVAYAREYCKELDHPFTSRTIVVTAMSGVAATWLHGETCHRALGLNKDQPSPDMIDSWFDTRLVIVDEVSFACGADITKIQKHCGILMKRTFEKYGGLNIVFAGDFSQLEPVGRSPLYDGRECPAFHHYMNTFIELDGHHRFKDDPVWGNRMQRFREGQPTQEDIQTINEKCSVSQEHVPARNIQIAAFFNKERDAMNCSIFERYCEQHGDVGRTFQDAIFILMDELYMRDSLQAYARVMSNAVKKRFYTNCSESSVKMASRQTGRVDPVLKLYTGCPLMYTQNSDVLRGQANGTRVFLKEVHVKTGEVPFELELSCGVRIRVFFASQVKQISVRHEKDDIQPAVFHVVAEKYTFTAKLKVDDMDDKASLVSMKGQQFGLISNSATTGHKLQGYTAIFLLVLSWIYRANWAYTVLSRVRTMAGLYIMQPLSNVLAHYEMPEAMKQMLHRFREALPLKLFQPEEYDSMLEKVERRMPNMTVRSSTVSAP